MPAPQVRANLVALSKSKHGHFLVQKLIAVAPKEEVPGERSKRAFKLFETALLAVTAAIQTIEPRHSADSRIPRHSAFKVTFKLHSKFA